MNEKNQQLLWDLNAGIARDAKNNQRLLWKLYAGIAKNVIKTQRIPWIDMQVLQEMPKKPTAIMDLYAGIAYLKITL